MLEKTKLLKKRREILVETQETQELNIRNICVRIIRHYSF